MLVDGGVKSEKKLTKTQPSRAFVLRSNGLRPAACPGHCATGCVGRLLADYMGPGPVARYPI
jgi:hypothetical protein